MNRLYEHLRAKNANGLPRTEAIQLFLWIYSSKDILPSWLQPEIMDKQTLVQAFEQLTSDGLVVVGEPEQSASGGVGVPWAGLVDALLANEVELDWDFKKRAGQYV